MDAGTGNSKARSAHARFARIGALILGGAVALLLTGGSEPYVFWGFRPVSWGMGFYPIWFAYVVFAVALGDLWESAVAVAAGVAAAGLLAYKQNPAIGYQANLGTWLLFALTAAVLVALVHGRRRARPAHDVAVPVISSNIEDPVLIIRGHAQVLQGAGVVFDTRQGTQATAEPVSVRARQGQQVE